MEYQRKLEKWSHCSVLSRLCSVYSGETSRCYLYTGVAGRHGLHIEWGPHHGLVCPEGGLGGPGAVALPSVGPHAEQVLGIVLQVGEHGLLVSSLPQLLLVRVRLLPELYLVLGDLTVPGMLWRRVVHDLHHIRGLEPP